MAGQTDRDPRRYEGQRERGRQDDWRDDRGRDWPRDQGRYERSREGYRGEYEEPGRRPPDDYRRSGRDYLGGGERRTYAPGDDYRPGERDYDYDRPRDREFDCGLPSGDQSLRYGGESSYGGARGGEWDRDQAERGSQENDDQYQRSYGEGRGGYGGQGPAGYSREHLGGYDRYGTYGRGGYDADWTRPGPFTGRGPRGYQRSDERIREDVCERLTRHGQLDASDVDVQVRGGEVTLTGMVDSRQAKRLAEDVADGVSGVRHVYNQLRVRERQWGGGTSGFQGTHEGYQQAGQRGGSMAQRSQIRQGMDVVGSDAERVGRVKEVRENYPVVDRTGQRDLQVPLDAVRDLMGDQVLLAVPGSRVDQMGWETTPMLNNVSAR